MDIKILENLLQETIYRGNLRDRHHQVIQKRIMVNLGLLKSGKVRLRRTIDQGNLIKLLGTQQICPHEDALLDGNAQSVRYGEMIHDGSVQPDRANSQEEADSEIFVMGNDAAEFVNKVKDQVRKRQKRMSNVARLLLPSSTTGRPWCCLSRRLPTRPTFGRIQVQARVPCSTDPQLRWSTKCNLCCFEHCFSRG